ncbi:hypothetical protein BDZ97DRAFT_1847806 [Flammula alnicola]|nr:hypothetical protein BDZ97DRAFT_1847806 [Flammula alnicola]
MSVTETAIILVNNDAMGLVTPSALDLPVARLSNNIQKATMAFQNVHKGLIIHKKSSKALEQLKNAKFTFKAKFETIRQVLQSSYRHTRSISAQRCQRSGRAILRDIQNVIRTYDTTLGNFKEQQHTFLPGEKVCRVSNGDAPNQYPLTEDSDIFVFWDGHVSFLTLVVNRQTNCPTPGEETKATVEVWTKYQRALLQSSSSISESVDEMTTEPTVPTDSTSPKLRREPTRLDTMPNPKTPYQDLSKHNAKPKQGHRTFADRLTDFIRRLF